MSAHAAGPLAEQASEATRQQRPKAARRLVGVADKMQQVSKGMILYLAGIAIVASAPIRTRGPMV